MALANAAVDFQADEKTRDGERGRYRRNGQYRGVQEAVIAVASDDQEVCEQEKTVEHTDNLFLRRCK